MQIIAYEGNYILVQLDCSAHAPSAFIRARWNNRKIPHIIQASSSYRVILVKRKVFYYPLALQYVNYELVEELLHEPALYFTTMFFWFHCCIPPQKIIYFFLKNILRNKEVRPNGRRRGGVKKKLWYFFFFFLINCENKQFWQIQCVRPTGRMWQLCETASRFQRHDMFS